MKKIITLLLMPYFLLGAETYKIAEIYNNVEDGVITGKVCFNAYKLIYAGSSTQLFSKAFNIDVQPHDLLVAILLAKKDSVLVDNQTHYEFADSFNNYFPTSLPLSLFQNKNTGDIIQLAFYGKAIHLVCSISGSLNVTFKDQYLSLLNTIFKEPNWNIVDTELLLDKNVLVKPAKDVLNGPAGYASLLRYYPPTYWPHLSSFCAKEIIAEVERLRLLSSSSSSDVQSKRYDDIAATVAKGKNRTECMQMITSELGSLLHESANHQ